MSRTQLKSAASMIVTRRCDAAGLMSAIVLWSPLERILGQFVFNIAFSLGFAVFETDTSQTCQGVLC